jgi:hypothetical protein
MSRRVGDPGPARRACDDTPADAAVGTKVWKQRTLLEILATGVGYADGFIIG